jgi:hypothetical protein
MRQQQSTSSPATRNFASKPPIAASRSRRTAMLQPGTCSATSSERSTWIGFPGALSTHSATRPSPGGATFGPPIAAWSLAMNAAARNVSQSGSG